MLVDAHPRHRRSRLHRPSPQRVARPSRRTRLTVLELLRPASCHRGRARYPVATLVRGDMRDEDTLAATLPSAPTSSSTWPRRWASGSTSTTSSTTSPQRPGTASLSAAATAPASLGSCSPARWSCTAKAPTTARGTAGPARTATGILVVGHLRPALPPLRPDRPECPGTLAGGGTPRSIPATSTQRPRLHGEHLTVRPGCRGTRWEARSPLRLHNVFGPGLRRDTPYAGVASLFTPSSLRGDHRACYEAGSSGSYTCAAPASWCRSPRGHRRLRRARRAGDRGPSPRSVASPRRSRTRSVARARRDRAVPASATSGASPRRRTGRAGCSAWRTTTALSDGLSQS